MTNVQAKKPRNVSDFLLDKFPDRPSVSPAQRVARWNILSTIKGYAGREGTSNEHKSLALCPLKPRWNTKKIFKIYQLFIYGDTQHLSNLFCKNVPKITTAEPRF